MRTISELAPNIEYVSRFDEELGALLGGELRRQRRCIELIASENIASSAVIACMGTVLTNKYAEGLPAKRYYGGCEVVDEVERLAIARAKQEPAVAEAMAGKTVAKEIYVKGKLVNIAVKG